jgi:hypothetical protein
MALASLISQWPSTWITSACTLTCDCGTIWFVALFNWMHSNWRCPSLPSMPAMRACALLSSPPLCSSMRGNAGRFVANAKIGSAIHPGRLISGAEVKVASGASSPIRSVVAHRLQSADSGRSRTTIEPPGSGNLLSCARHEPSAVCRPAYAARSRLRPRMAISYSRKQYRLPHGQAVYLGLE